jgi:hypothetical protein
MNSIVALALECTCDIWYFSSLFFCFLLLTSSTADQFTFQLFNNNCYFYSSVVKRMRIDFCFLVTHIRKSHTWSEIINNWALTLEFRDYIESCVVATGIRHACRPALLDICSYCKWMLYYRWYFLSSSLD